MSEERRIGKGYQWKSSGDSGYCVDHLDTRQRSEIVGGADLFDKLFILIREAIQSYRTLDRGYEGDDLDVCHHISRHISRNKNFIK